MIQLQKMFWSSAALGNTAARASARSCLEDVIRGGEGGSVSSVLLVVVEDAESESRALRLRGFARNDGTSSFDARHSDTRASADLPRRCMTCPEPERWLQRGEGLVEGGGWCWSFVKRGRLACGAVCCCRNCRDVVCSGNHVSVAVIADFDVRNI